MTYLVRWDLVVPAIVALAAAVSCVRAARRATTRPARVAWSSQSAACALWVLAPIGWLAGVQPLADAGRAAFLAWTAAGFWAAGRGLARRTRWRPLLDGGIGAAVGLVLVGKPIAEADGPAHLVFPLAGVALSILGSSVAMALFRAGDRGAPAWLVAGLLAVTAADLDAGRGAGSAGLGWLLGFGCLGLAAHLHRAPVAQLHRNPVEDLRRAPAARPASLDAVLASFDEQLQLASDLRDLPGPAASALGEPAPAAERPTDLLGVAGGSLYEAKRPDRKRTE